MSQSPCVPQVQAKTEVPQGLPTRAQCKAHWTHARSSTSSQKTCGMKNYVWVSNFLHPNTLVIPLLHSLCLRSSTDCSGWSSVSSSCSLHELGRTTSSAPPRNGPSAWAPPAASARLHQEGTATPHAARGKGRAQGRTTHATQQGPSVRFRFRL